MRSSNNIVRLADRLLANDRPRRGAAVRLLAAVLAAATLLFVVEGCAPPPKHRRGEDRRAEQEAMAGTVVEPSSSDAVDPDPAKPPESRIAMEDAAVAPDAGADPAEEPGAEQAAPAQEQPIAAVRSTPARKAGKVSPEDMIRLMGLDRDSKRKEAIELVKLAETEKERLEPEKAEANLEAALKLDPSNQKAQLLLGEIRTVLGDKRGEITQVAHDFQNERRVAIKQHQAEVRNSINSAARRKDQKDFDGSIQDYEKAIQLIRNFPFNLQLDPEMRDAESGLVSARDGKKSQTEQDRLELEKRMLETKDTERRNTVDLLQNRVKELRKKAEESWERHDFARVEEVCGQILVLLPDDRDAAALQKTAKNERHLQNEHKIVMDQLENHERALLSLEESTISYQLIFRYPPSKEWQRLQPKTVSLEERVAAEESVVEKEIRRKLDEPQTIGFPEKIPFLEAMKVLSQIGGINFLLTKDAQEAVKQDDLKVELAQQRDSPLKSILGLMLQAAGDKNFQYTIENGAVVIGPKETLKIRTYTEFYDVKDVTQAHPDFPAPPIALDELAGKSSTSQSIDTGSDSTVEQQGPVEIDKLIGLISKEIKGPNDETVGAEPKFQNGKLMVKTTLENHQKVQRLLAQLRKATGIMVTVESRFLDIQDNFLEEIGVDIGNGNNTFLPNTIPDIDGSGTSISPGYEYVNNQGDYDFRAATIGGLSQPLGSQVNPFNVSAKGGGAYQLNIFDAERFQLEAILTGVGKEQEKKSLNSPRVTAFNSQISHTLVINQAAYIQDLEVNQTGVIPVINPVIGVLNSGSILEVRPTVSYDRKYVVLEIQPTLAEKLQSETALLNLSGNFTSVPVELPVLSVTRIKTTVTIPDGGTVLVGGLKREIHSKSSIGVPILRNIPILNLLFGRVGEATMRSSLFVLINAKITVVQEEEERLFNM